MKGDQLKEVTSKPVAHLRLSPSPHLSSRTRHVVRRSPTGKGGLSAGQDTDDRVEAKGKRIQDPVVPYYLSIHQNNASSCV